MKRMPLREAIPFICRELSLSPAQLARRIDMSDVAVRNWVNGTSGSVKKIRARHLLGELARQAGITIEELE